ncbi:hypothetical protein [Burkholderia seminalis]|uniref:hypothetical protein n=1 Tax=Burkholderia seminalis TaxID=488731 RepID=UPI000F59B326|nr:hypothetical protein [Burkholderia seminalis]RQS98559.1 hypothetical protein DF048_05185 [Burkholderia seminalis]
MQASAAPARRQPSAFDDANKLTGLTCASTDMVGQGTSIPRVADLEDLMVDMANASVTSEERAEYFHALRELSRPR